MPPEPALGRHRRPTLKSVATRAGVSVSTASLVFSGKGPVSDSTRGRVHTAAAELGYLGPDPLASSLRRGRAGVVAVIVEGRLLHAFHDPYAVATLDGLASVLDDIPTGMLLMSQSPTRPEHAFERLAGTALDACVFLGGGPKANPLVEHLRSRGIPMVALGAPSGPDVVQVDVDNRAAMRQLAEHLVAQGHRRVGHVALPVGTQAGSDAGPAAGRAAGSGAGPERAPEVMTLARLSASRYPDCAQRARGLADILGPDAPAVLAPHADVDGGLIAATALLGLPPHARPTAIAAQSDLLAVGVVRAAENLGLRVPQAVSVTGFDGIPIDWWPGTLTTVAQPSTGKGEAAGRAVRALLDGGRPGDVTLPTQLRIGTTSGPAPNVDPGPDQGPPPGE